MGKHQHFKMLASQATQKHLVVDSIYITFAQMAPQSAMKVLEEIKRELQAKKDFQAVYWEFLDKFHKPSYEVTLRDGTVLKGNKVHIGNLGEIVLSANGNKLFSHREELMPKKHIQKLFASKAGDVLILYDKEDLSNYPNLRDKETGERYVLHRVREIYAGP